MGIVIKRGYVSLAHGQVHYREVGTRGAPTVLWLHQSPSSSEMYEALIRELGDGYHHLAPDTPGFGQSDSLPAFTISKFGNIMAEFLEAMNISHAHVFGHHTGASVAVALAAQNPEMVSKLALGGPPMLTEALRKTLPSLATHEGLKPNGSHLAALWAKIRAKEPDVSLEISQREVLYSSRAMGINQAVYQAVADHDFGADIRSVKKPVFVFAGDRDPLYGCLDAAFAALQDGKKSVIEGASSYICESHTSIVAAKLIDFFGES